MLASPSVAPADKRIVLPNGLECYHNSSEEETRHIFAEIFTEGQYEGHGITIGEGGVVFDVGANIGLFTIFVKRLRPNAGVFAFEPIKPTFDALRKNIELHSLDGVTPLNFGLSSEDNPAAVFTHYPNMSANSTTRPDDTLADPGDIADRGDSPRVDNLFERLFEERQVVECELRTLSSVIADLGVTSIDLLKIDVEGEEYEVLRGIDPGDWPRIRQIVAEVHDKRGRLRQFARLLAENGFTVELERRQQLPSDFVDIYHVYAVR